MGVSSQPLGTTVAGVLVFVRTLKTIRQDVLSLTTSILADRVLRSREVTQCMETSSVTLPGAILGSFKRRKIAAGLWRYEMIKNDAEKQCHASSPTADAFWAAVSHMRY